VENEREIFILNVNNFTNSSGSKTKPSTQFNDLFQCRTERECLVCHKNIIHHEQTSFSIPNENRYIFMQCFNVSINQATFRDLLITNMDPEYVQLPLFDSSQTITYKVIAVIVRHGQSMYGGHFVCWRRNENNSKWLRISDDSVIRYDKLINNFKNAYLIILERI
jgi:uncharacterized UBP type Zn finger protein